MKRSKASKRQFMLTAMLARDPLAAHLHHRHLQVLECICRSTSPITAGKIASTVKLSPSQLSRLLASLEEQALLTRSETKPAFIRPTDQARAMIHRITSYFETCRADTDLTAA